MTIARGVTLVSCVVAGCLLCLAASRRAAGGAPPPLSDIVRSAAAQAGDVPGFNEAHAPNVTERSKDGVTAAWVDQFFQRNAGPTAEGQDPSSMAVRFLVLPDRAFALKQAAAECSHQLAGGWPSRSLTGAAIGEASWAPPADTRTGSTTLVVQDGRCVVKVILMYAGVPWPSKHSTGTTHFQAISADDQKLMEQVAAKILGRLAAQGLTVKTKPAPAAAKKR